MTPAVETGQVAPYATLLTSGMKNAINSKNSRLVFRPEIELLLCCCRKHLEVERAERLEGLISRGMDWEYLLKAAKRHGLMPLLYKHISAVPHENVPIEVMGTLRENCQLNSLRNLSLMRELIDLLKAFELNFIPAIPFKGPILAASLYGNLALRQFLDLDVLVHMHDVLDIKKVLLNLGYEPVDNMLDGKEGEFLRSECEYRFYHERKRVALEIHWEITPRYFSFQLDHESLWRDARRAPFNGAEILSLTSIDLLLILSVHACKHLWDRLIWICDVAELIKIPGLIDWSDALGKAKVLGAERMLLLGLFLANDLTGVELPPEPLRRIQSDPALDGLAEEVREELFKDEAGPTDVLKTVLFHIKARERLSDKVRYCSRLGLTPNDADKALVRVPSGLAPLHYIWRLFRITWKYGIVMTTRLRQGRRP